MSDPLAAYAVPEADPLAAYAVPDEDVLTRPQAKAQRGIMHAVIAGLEGSATGLAVRGDLPESELMPDPTRGERLAATGASIVADLPLSVAAALGGGAAGTAVAGPPGTLIGGGAAAMAVPMGLREALITAYQQKGGRSFSEVWEITKSALEGGGKGLVIGAATMGAGRYVGSLGMPVMKGGAIVQGAAITTAEIATLATTAAALEGHLPTNMEIEDAAVLLFGIKGAVYGAQRIGGIYAKTGIPPNRMVLDAIKDPKLRDEIVSGTKDVPTRYEPLASHENAKAAVPDPVSGAKDRPTAVRFVEEPFAPTGQAKGAPTRPTHINYEYINGPEDLSGALSRLSGLYEKQIETSRRGTVSMEQTATEAKQVLADMLGVTADKVPTAPGGGPVHKPVPLILKGRDVDFAATESGLPLVPKGHVRVYRASSPTVKFDDVFDTAKMQGFKTDMPGQRYTTDLAYADYFRATYGRDATINYVDVPKALLKGKQVKPGEYVLDLAASPSGINPAKLAATLQAKRQMAVDAAAELKARGKELADLGPAATEAQMSQYLAMVERSGMILAEFLGLRAEVGRAQQSLKAMVSESRDLTAMQNALEGYGGKDKILDFARLMGDADNPTSALRAAREFTKPTMLQKTIEVWKASILSGPTTQLANIFGNVGAMIMKFPERAVAAGVGKVLGSKDGVALGETRAFGAGLVQGSLDALKLSGAAVRDAFMLRDRAPDPSKTEQYRHAVGGKAGEVVRTPFKLLTAGDLLFRTLNERGEAHALAFRQSLKEGFEPGTREFNARVVDLVQNPSEVMAQAIKDAGDKAVFTKKLGKTGTHLQLMVKDTPLEFVLPFVKTPINLVKWSAEYMPGVNLLMSSVRDDLAGKNGAAARDLATARMIIGGTVATVIIDQVAEGNITGGGLAEPEKKRAQMAAGWQPYSIKIDGRYYSYQRIEPIAKLLATAADTAELYEAAKGDERMNLPVAITAAVGNATVSQTYLLGLSNAMNAITDPGRYGGRWADQYAASLVPSLLGQTAAAMDPQSREVNSILDAMQARLPHLREQLLPVRNPLTGEPAAGKDRAFPFSPITVTKESKDKVLTEAARLGVRLPIAPRKVQVGRGTGKLGAVEITPEARNKYTEVQGQFAHEILTRLVDSPAWERMPDLQKEKVYSKVMAAARKKASLEALPPEARMAEAARISMEISEQMNR